MSKKKIAILKSKNVSSRTKITDVVCAYGQKTFEVLYEYRDAMQNTIPNSKKLKSGVKMLKRKHCIFKKSERAKKIAIIISERQKFAKEEMEKLAQREENARWHEYIEMKTSQEQEYQREIIGKDTINPNQARSITGRLSEIWLGK